MRIKQLFGLVLLINLCGLSVMSINPVRSAEMVMGWIVIEPYQQERIRVIGKAYSLSPVHGRYSLRVERKSRGGHANTGQKGAFDLKDGELKQLSVTTLNITPGDELSITLELYENGVKISSSSVAIAGSKAKDI